MITLPEDFDMCIPWSTDWSCRAHAQDRSRAVISPFIGFQQVAKKATCWQMAQSLQRKFSIKERLLVQQHFLLTTCRNHQIFKGSFCHSRCCGTILFCLLLFAVWVYISFELLLEVSFECSNSFALITSLYHLCEFTSTLEIKKMKNSTDTLMLK